MPSLLDLPSEVRAQIIDLVILHCRKKPNLESVDDGRLKVLHRELKPGCRCIRGINFEVDPKLYEPNTDGLLRTNHQLRIETFQQLALRRPSAAFELDIICADDHQLRPTWLRIPTVTRDVQTLNVTLRPLQWGTHTALGPPECNPLGVGRWCAYSSIYALLERFLEVGPSVPSQDVCRSLLNGRSGCDRDENSYLVSVRSLVINVEPMWPVADPFIMWEDPRYDLRGLGIGPPTSPQEGVTRVFGEFTRFKAIVCGSLSSILKMGGVYHMRYGTIACRYFGSIKICVQGTVIKEYDLGQRLGELHEIDSDEEDIFEDSRSDWYKTWRIKTIESRRSRGLPVPENNSQSVQG